MLAKQTYVFTCYSFDVLLSVYLQSLHFQILENLRDILLVLWALTCYFLNSQYSCVYLYLRQVFFSAMQMFLWQTLLQQSEFELNQITVFFNWTKFKEIAQCPNRGCPWMAHSFREKTKEGNQSLDVCFMDSVIFKNKKILLCFYFLYFDLHITKSLSNITLRIRFVMSTSIQLFIKVLGLKTGFA